MFVLVSSSLPLNMTQEICFRDPFRSLDRLVDLLQVPIHCAVEVQCTGTGFSGRMQREVACAIDEAIDFLHFQRSHGCSCLVCCFGSG